MYGTPCLVVLDEPNANLDEAGDVMLAQAIDRIRQAGITLVLITHKSNILKQADKLLALQEGVQTDFGPLGEVMQRMQQMVKPRQQSQPQSLPQSRVMPLPTFGTMNIS